MDELLSFFPSSALRERISSSDHAFSDAERLILGYRFAPPHDERMRWLAAFAEGAEAVYADYARRIMAHDEARVARFTAPAEGYVYELSVQTAALGTEERCICDSFAAAVRMIGRYFEGDCTDETMRSSGKYHITKHRLLSADRDWWDDPSAVCRVDGDGQVLELWDDDEFRGECPDDVACCDCTAFCLHGDVGFPAVNRAGDILRYVEDHYPGAAVKYGICPFTDTSPSDEVYVYPLDSEAVRRCDTSDEALTRAHEHVPLPYCEVIALEDLPDERMRAETMAFWTALSQLPWVKAPRDM